MPLRAMNPNVGEERLLDLSLREYYASGRSEPYVRSPSSGCLGQKGRTNASSTTTTLAASRLSISAIQRPTTSGVSTVGRYE